MSAKKRAGHQTALGARSGGDRSRGTAPGSAARRPPGPGARGRAAGATSLSDARVFGLPARIVAIVGSALGVVVLTVGAILLLGVGAGGGAKPSPSQWKVAGTTGSWTNVNPDRLAEMLASKDFTLVNVKTPYYAEIEKTDLFIPYDQIAAQASKLPQDKAAKILVYCRSGVESKQASDTLVSLGYTNVWNLDGGMLAWQDSGRQLLYTHKP